MGKRRKARECALQVLFQLEFNAADTAEVVRRYWEYQKTDADVKEYGTWLVEGIRAERDEVDRTIQDASVNWRIARMAVVDRNIIRIAVYEMLRGQTLVPAIIINEAIEIAKKYSGEEAAVFINGVLDAIRKKLGKNAPPPKAGIEEGTHEPSGSKTKTGKKRS
ncbi:MAG: transcription antitermination factor NusB [Candidatus Aminicenantales bacterium]